MLELRPICENCAAPLPPDSGEAWICSMECTFCADCVEYLLKNTCPNCGGDFTARPYRPKVLLKKYPPTKVKIHKPVDLEAHQETLRKMNGIPAHMR
ncbi:MAG: DUF1272 domain-containing protein [Saprospiraceae bacterium]|jgi:hypothetical protein